MIVKKWKWILRGTNQSFPDDVIHPVLIGFTLAQAEIQAFTKGFDILREDNLRGFDAQTFDANDRTKLIAVSRLRVNQRFGERFQDTCT